MGKVSAFFDLNQEVSLSAGHDRMVVFARRETGELAHISEVANGKACQCACLACDEVMIARQGEIREHSFAHQSGTQCRHALEAMMHAVTAALIERYRRFVTPALHVQASVAGPHGPIAGTRVQPAIQVPVDGVELAKQAPWKHRSVMASVRGHSLLIHIAIRRPADAGKRAALLSSGQAAVQIDLTRHAPKTVAELAEVLFASDERKTWLHNPKTEVIAAEIRTELKPVAEQRWVEHREALEVRRRQDQERAAVRAEHERQRVLAMAERDRQRASGLLAQAAEPHSVAGSHQAPIDREAPTGPVVHKAPRPQEFSPSVEYTSASGRVWLLHSSLPDIHFKADVGVDRELQVLYKHGAVEDVQAGVFRISREGWSAASIELAGSWSRVRSVSS